MSIAGEYLTGQAILFACIALSLSLFFEFINGFHDTANAVATEAIEYIPIWIKAVVAISLGLGTMIGWKRIVVTVAERIGKSRLGYGQGASAELTTMATILFADRLGLPVSTTHVLTSGIAGTMVANRAGVQRRTVRNIILAWVLTLPVCIFLGAVLFAAALFVFFNLLGWK